MVTIDNRTLEEVYGADAYTWASSAVDKAIEIIATVEEDRNDAREKMYDADRVTLTIHGVSGMSFDTSWGAEVWYNAIKPYLLRNIVDLTSDYGLDADAKYKAIADMCKKELAESAF